MGRIAPVALERFLRRLHIARESLGIAQQVPGLDIVRALPGAQPGKYCAASEKWRAFISCAGQLAQQRRIVGHEPRQSRESPLLRRFILAQTWPT